MPYIIRNGKEYGGVNVSTASTTSYTAPSSGATANKTNVQNAIDALNSNLNNKVDNTDSRLTDARTPTSHTHDDRYYTENEINTLLGNKSGLIYTDVQYILGTSDIQWTLSTNNRYETPNYSVTVPTGYTFLFGILNIAWTGGNQELGWDIMSPCITKTTGKIGAYRRSSGTYGLVLLAQCFFIKNT